MFGQLNMYLKAFEFYRLVGAGYVNVGAVSRSGDGPQEVSQVAQGSGTW